jgi:hypothetical protein
MITTGFFSVTFLLFAVARWVSGSTGNLHDVVYPHPTGEQCDCEKKAHDQNGDKHKNPGKWFKAAIAETLEYTGAAEADDYPPYNTV